VGEIIACIGAAKYVPDTGKHASRAILLLKNLVVVLFSFEGARKR
jgi:hypothetical protein